MFSKKQHITITWNGKTYAGKVIQAETVFSTEMGQFVVIKLDIPIGQQKTQCMRVNGTAIIFGFEGAKATLASV